MPLPVPILQTLRREFFTLVLLLFVGVLLLPTAVYLVGQQVFGDYGGHGFGGFFRHLHGEARAGNPVVLFLLLSPYLLWQAFRLTIFAFRRRAREHTPEPEGGT